MKTINQLNSLTNQRAVTSFVKNVEKNFSMNPKNLNRVRLAGEARLAELKAKAASKKKS